MARYKTLVQATGAVSVVDSKTTGASVPPTVVGSAPQWADGSDATYAELETFEDPDASAADLGLSDLPAVPSLNLNPDTPILALIRYQSMSSDMAPPRVLARRGNTTVAEGDIGGPGSSGIAEVAIPLTLAGAYTLSEFETLLRDGGITLLVAAPFLRVYERSVRTRVYEASLVVEVLRVAPPARLFPREDGLGVGGGRVFPPPKSQQRSGRRFGHY